MYKFIRAGCNSWWN